MRGVFPRGQWWCTYREASSGLEAPDDEALAARYAMVGTDDEEEPSRLIINSKRRRSDVDYQVIVPEVRGDCVR